MRILHTADWHLGKIVNEFSMLDLQADYLQTLVEQIKKLDVDALIMAGDLYDRALPPKEAVSLANHIFTQLTQDVGIPVFVIAGNHDSNERVEYGSDLLAGSKLYIEGTTKQTVRKVSFDAADFYLLPYDDHRNIKRVLDDDAVRNPEAGLEAQMDQVKNDWDEDKLNILLYHGFLINKNTEQLLEESDSERPLTVGTADYIPAELVNDFDYVALGHLHKAQKVKSNHIRYSGSPLKYSKSEANHHKQNLLVDITEDGLDVETIAINPAKDLRIIRGHFADIMEEKSEDYIFFELENTEYVRDAMNQLRKRYPYAMGLEYIHSKQKEEHQVFHSKEKMQQKNLDTLFDEFYEENIGMPLNEEQKQAVVETVDALKEEEKDA